MQSIIFINLIQTAYVGFAVLFFAESMKIATTDVMQGEKIIKYLYKFNQTQPLSPHFENSNVETMNFLINTGSIIYPLYMVAKMIFIFSKVINCLAFLGRSY